MNGDAIPERARPLLATVGNTPLVEVSHDRIPAGVRLFAKLESLNPGGSIKDRPVARMLVEGLRQGRFAGGRRLLDSSSGNAGIAYAQFGAALGVPVSLVVPGNASRERLDRIRSHGAELILTDPMEGYDFALREAQRLAEAQPDRYWYSNQYANDDNWRAHYTGTGAEILAQLTELGLGAPAAFVAGVGTGGCITGVGRRLREIRGDVHIAAAIPELFPGIEGLKPLGAPDDIVPEILDSSLIDERLDVTLDDGLGLCRELCGQGLFVGPSSGAYLWAALRVAERGTHDTIVTIFSDTGERYVSTEMWSPDGA